MKIIWSLPVMDGRLDGSRGDLVRARRLVDALRALGHEVRVVERAARPGAGLPVAVYRRGVRRLLPPAVALPARDVGRALHTVRHARRVGAVARAEAADLVIETQVHLAVSAAMAFRRIDAPVLLDDCSPPAEEELLGTGLPGLARSVFRRQAGAASALSVSSDEIAELLLREGVPERKLRVVPNGVDLRAFEEADRDAIRRRLGLQDRLVIGFIGSFQPWHRAELLPTAVALTSWPAQVVLVGAGPGLPRAVDEARRCRLEDRFRAVGAVAPDETPGWIRSFDIGVLPGSNDYGHPMKLLEYAAAGLPIVAPDLPPVRRIIRHDDSGLLFPPGDAAALAAALSRLAEDPPLRRRLGERARASVAAAAWSRRARMLIAGLAPPGCPDGV